jgi:hypothetical protein
MNTKNNTLPPFRNYYTLQANGGERERERSKISKVGYIEALRYGA